MQKKKKVVKKVSKSPKKLRGIVHYCDKCKKTTKHYAQGKRWVKYVERCKNCDRINYSEIATM